MKVSLRLDEDGAYGLTSRLALLEALESGVLDRLTCPECGAAGVSVWFTHPAANEYRTWFVCTNCSFSMRAQNSERPRFFCDSRIDERLEANDASVLKKNRKTGGLKDGR